MFNHLSECRKVALQEFKKEASLNGEGDPPGILQEIKISSYLQMIWDRWI